MKSKKDFLENFARYPVLARRTLRQGGVDWKTIVSYPDDYYTANSGSVGGMIYYSDTVPFAKRNIIHILQALYDFEEECGVLKKPRPNDETQYYNWLSWFAWENTIGEIISYLEN